MFGGRDRQIFLALKMMKETALGEPRRLANILYSGCGVTLRPYDLKRRFEQLFL